MGNRLVALAQMPRSDMELSSRARVVLLVMASKARDDDPQPTYFGGWHYLAGALGFDVFTPAANKAITRAIRELRDCKLVTTTGKAAPGKRVGYRLHLAPWGDN